MRETRTQQALGSHGHSRVTDSPGISHRKPGLGRSQGQPYPEAQGGYFCVTGQRPPQPSP